MALNLFKKKSEKTSEADNASNKSRPVENKNTEKLEAPPQSITPDAIKLETYGDVKALIKGLKKQQLKENIIGESKSFGKKQLIKYGVKILEGFIPGVSYAKTAYDFVSAIAAKPKIKKSKTWLDKLHIDDKTAAIVDDTVENGFIKKQSEIIEGKPDNEKLKPNFNMNQELTEYLSEGYEGRHVKGYAYGGNITNQKSISGEIVKKSKGVQIKPTKQGDNIIAALKPGEVVLNEQQQTALGGDSTFSEIGVPGFADGGKTTTKKKKPKKKPKQKARLPKGVKSSSGTSSIDFDEDDDETISSKQKSLDIQLKQIAAASEIQGLARSVKNELGTQNEVYRGIQNYIDQQNVGLTTIAGLEKQILETNKENASIVTKANNAYDAYESSVASVTEQFALGSITQKEANNKIEEARDKLEKALIPLQSIGEAGKDVAEIYRTIADSGKKLATVNAKTADSYNFWKQQGEKIKGQIPLMSELSNVMSSLNKNAGVARAAFVALGAAMGDLIGKAFFGDVLAYFKTQNDIAQSRIELERDSAKALFETDQLYKTNFLTQKAMINIDRKRVETEFEIAKILMKNQQLEAGGIENKRIAAAINKEIAKGVAKFEVERLTAFFGEKLPQNLGYTTEAFVKAGVSAKDITTSMTAFGKEVGHLPTGEIAGTMSMMSAAIGVSGDTLSKINKSFTMMDGLSETQALNMEAGMRAMAKASSLPLDTLMQEVADASANMLSYGIKNTENLIKQVGAVESLGVSFQTVANAGRNMVLNYKDSIKAEMQLSALLGEQVDLSEVRAQMAAGDYSGAIQSLQGMGLDIESMNMFQLEGLSQAIGGMDTGSLTKILKGEIRTPEDLKPKDAKFEMEKFADALTSGKMNLAVKEARIDNIDAILQAKLDEDFFKIIEASPANKKYQQQLARVENATKAFGVEMEAAWKNTDEYNKSLRDLSALDVKRMFTDKLPEIGFALGGAILGNAVFKKFYGGGAAGLSGGAPAPTAPATPGTPGVTPPGGQSIPAPGTKGNPVMVGNKKLYGASAKAALKSGKGVASMQAPAPTAPAPTGGPSVSSQAGKLPKGTRLNKAGKLIDAKTGKFVKVPPAASIVDDAAAAGGKGLKGTLGKVADKVTSFTKSPAMANSSKLLGRMGMAVTGIIGGIQGFQEAREKGATKEQAMGAATVRGGAGVGGAALGASLGAAIGTAILPGVGTALGSFLGGALGGWIGDSIGGWLNENAPWLANAFAQFFMPMKTIWEGLQKIWENIKAKFEGIGNTFGRIFDMIGFSMGDAGETGGVLGKVFEYIGNIASVIFLPLEWLGGVLELLGSVVQFVGSIIEGVIVLFQDPKKGLAMIGDAFLNLFVSLGDALKSAMGQLWNRIVDVFFLPDSLKVDVRNTETRKKEVKEKAQGLASSTFTNSKERAKYYEENKVSKDDQAAIEKQLRQQNIQSTFNKLVKYEYDQKTGKQRAIFKSKADEENWNKYVKGNKITSEEQSSAITTFKQSGRISSIAEMQGKKDRGEITQEQLDTWMKSNRVKTWEGGEALRLNKQKKEAQATANEPKYTLASGDKISEAEFQAYKKASGNASITADQIAKMTVDQYQQIVKKAPASVTQKAAEIAAQEAEEIKNITVSQFAGQSPEQIQKMTQSVKTFVSELQKLSTINFTAAQNNIKLIYDQFTILETTMKGLVDSFKQLSQAISSSLVVKKGEEDLLTKLIKFSSQHTLIDTASLSINNLSTSVNTLSTSVNTFSVSFDKLTNSAYNLYNAYGTLATIQFSVFLENIKQLHERLSLASPVMADMTNKTNQLTASLNTFSNTVTSAMENISKNDIFSKITSFTTEQNKILGISNSINSLANSFVALANVDIQRIENIKDTLSKGFWEAIGENISRVSKAEVSLKAQADQRAFYEKGLVELKEISKNTSALVELTKAIEMINAAQYMFETTGQKPIELKVDGKTLAKANIKYLDGIKANPTAIGNGTTRK